GVQLPSITARVTTVPGRASRPPLVASCSLLSSARISSTPFNDTTIRAGIDPCESDGACHAVDRWPTPALLTPALGGIRTGWAASPGDSTTVQVAAIFQTPGGSVQIVTFLHVCSAICRRRARGQQSRQADSHRCEVADGATRPDTPGQAAMRAVAGATRQEGRRASHRRGQLGSRHELPFLRTPRATGLRAAGGPRMAIHRPRRNGTAVGRRRWTATRRADRKPRRTAPAPGLAPAARAAADRAAGTGGGLSWCPSQAVMSPRPATGKLPGRPTPAGPGTEPSHARGRQ